MEDKESHQVYEINKAGSSLFQKGIDGSWLVTMYTICGFEEEEHQKGVINSGDQKEVTEMVEAC